MTKDEPLSREQFIRYLYGQMSEPEREGIEMAFADADSTAFDDLLTFEDQLIDDYVRGQMREEERRAFEKHYANFSRRRRERVELACSLAAHADELPALVDGPPTTIKVASVALAPPPDAPRRHFWNPVLTGSVAALSLIASIVVAVLHFRLLSTTPQDTGQVASRQAGGAEPSASTDARMGTPIPKESVSHKPQHESPNKGRASSGRNSAPPRDNPNSTREEGVPAPGDGGEAVYAAVIPPSSSERSGRPGQSTMINIIQGRAFLDLTLPLREGHVFKKYRAVVVTRGGKKIGPAGGLEATTDASNRFVKLKLRAELLPPGDYSIKLYGIDPEIDPGEIPVDDYPFSLRTGKTPAN